MPEPDPLRVCYLVAFFHPFESGAERQALAQGTELVRLGHTVHVVTRAVPGVPADELVRGIHVHRWIRASPRGPLFSLSFVASALRALRRLRSSHGIDLIHTHQALWEAVAAGASRCGAVRGVPTVVQPASSGFYGEAEELLRTKGSGLLRRLILRNDVFVAISADIERQWLELGVPRDRMVRIASGVDSGHFAPGPAPDRVAEELRLPPRPRVVFTGRLHPQKNLDVLIDAWPAVWRATGASLVLVGQGTERERLEEKARGLGVSEVVRFTGAVDDPAEVLRAADVFALPSVAEGMSNSLLEAMATALPCVASDIGGNQDLLGPGDAGVLVGGGSPERWAASLIGLLNDEESRGRLGVRARRRVDEEFALGRVVSRYVDLYRTLLAGAQTKGPAGGRA
jgi:glycosyltransferase involved in cell wall biosynthesis